MSCREVDALLISGREADFETHRDSCPECDGLGRVLSRNREVVESLAPPAWTPALREALLRVPQETVTCEAAAALLARAPDETLAADDSRRLSSHVSRCDGCREASAVLGLVRELETPAASPWLATRLAAARPIAPTRGTGRRLSRLWNPRAAIALAYAAAVVVMILGWNPADLARKARGSLQAGTREALTAVSGTAVDRLGAVNEKLMRRFAIWKGRAGGYSRAALSNALALVMRSEPRRSPNRPRNDEGSGVWKRSETEILTWRA